MKLHLCFAGIMLLVVIAPTTAAETETERVKQTQGLFQPLPRDMATPEAPITPQRVDLGRLLFFDSRLTVDADVSCASCLNQHATERTGYPSRSVSGSDRIRAMPRQSSMPGSISSFTGAATGTALRIR